MKIIIIVVFVVIISVMGMRVMNSGVNMLNNSNDRRIEMINSIK